MLNSLYGALGNKHFKYGEVENAEAITLYGQVVNKTTQIYINELMNGVAGTEGVDTVKGGDTDSLLFDTLLNTSYGPITIGDFYEKYGEHYLRDLPDNKIRAVTKPITTPSVSSRGQLEHNQINYVMKHKVKKEMFKVSCGGKEVIITRDHSLVVWRDGKTQSIKPEQVQENDQLLMIVE